MAKNTLNLKIIVYICIFCGSHFDIFFFTLSPSPLESMTPFSLNFICKYWLFISKEFLAKATVPEQCATISFVTYAMLISSFSANFIPEHITDSREDQIFGFSFMSNTHPNFCCLSLLFWFVFSLKCKVLDWYLHTSLTCVSLLDFFSSVCIINQFLSSLVFTGPFFFLNYCCESQKDSAGAVTGVMILVIMVLYICRWIYLLLLPPEFIHCIC